ncbi:putative argonaut-like protein [Leptomonas pyrrhocoris]|uniref:Putative argonaut-like protein n=1 Tax=Leptomonas pyrrhocoris TaxID=157538 RepID=A0A0M9FXV2_LEPPY|nr:putative argonaut-like protein [Leptomonas pyrrhocoris]KPA78159.1 putative argonaut-like protein [Leptomonas pyrrhocoris]|eukprot:XP_015656598.1 putative argonaut-like protein [Leptomonas pyrrhocoris]
MLRLRRTLVRRHEHMTDLFLPRCTPVLCSASRQLYGRPYAEPASHRIRRQADSNGAGYPPPPPNGAPQRPPSSGTWGPRGGRGGGGYTKTYRGSGRAVHDRSPAVALDDNGVARQDAPLSRYSAGSVRRADAATAAAASAETCRSFWSQRVRHVPAGDLKRQHLMESTHDKHSRFLVRSRIRDDGVLSNLFPVRFHDDAALKANGEKHDPYVYIYEMYVTRMVTSRAPAAAPGGRPSAAWGKYRQTPPSTAAQLSKSNERGGAATAGAVIATDSAAPSMERRVTAGRSWRAIQRYLRHRFAAAASTLLPPLVQLDNKIYAAAPLPADALQLPKTYFDVGWKTAELRLVSRSRYADLPASELQMVMNKIVLEMARETQRQRQRIRDGTSTTAPHRHDDGDVQDDDGLEVMEVVREKTGKLVCTTQGVSSGGLRVYRGIYVQAIFVDHTAALAYAEDSNDDEKGGGSGSHSDAAPQGGDGRTSSSKGTTSTTGSVPPPPTTRQLNETPVGLTDAANPIQFRVDAFLRAFTYRGTPVESYRISDASGSVLASVWAPPQPQSLLVGGVYAAAPVRIREFAERGNARLVEVPSGTVPTLLAAPPQPAPLPSAAPPPTATSSRSRQAPPEPPSRLPGHISLRIDTKGTIASETSLWGEVLQHYGAGPYDDATQQRIRKALAHMPVVISYSLRQGIVREVRFDGAALLAAASASDPLLGMAQKFAVQTTSELPSPSAATSSCAAGLSESETQSRGPVMGAREPRLLPLLPYLDAQQPCAVLTDYTVVPLQVLHCCFDPAMRNWQDIGVAVLSLMPNQRMELLSFVRKLLSRGLRRWGIEVAHRPWRTRSLSLLPAPMKRVVPNPAARSAASFPSTVAVLGIAGPRCTADQTQRVSLTAQHMAQYFRTNLVACLPDESAGVQYVHDQLMMHTSTPQQQPGGSASLRDVNSCVILITTEPDTRATRWLKVECMSRGIHLVAVLPSSSPKRLNLICGNLRRRIATQFELDPLRGIDLRAEVPVLGRRRVLIVGVDTCHTNTHSIGTIVGILATPTRNHLLSHFWQHDARGREASHVAVHFKNMLTRVLTKYGGVDEVVIFQDGDVFSELTGMKEELVAQLPECGLTFMCLHKRCNIRFTHTSSSSSTADAAARDAQRDGGNASVEASFHNVVKGVVITALAPIPLDYEAAAPSFYLQAHESVMSTARAVQYTVHHVSPTLDVADVQQMANVMANVLAPQATKLPMSTRCAHRLADRAERLLDAVPQFTGEMIPQPLSDRLWFL